MNGKFSLNKILLFCLSFALLGLGVFYFSQQNSQSQPKSLKISDLANLPKLELGDLIFREGIDNDSLVIQEISKHFLTHVDVIASVSPIKIIHASSGDTKYKVSLSSLDEFILNAKSIAIKRFDISDESKDKFINNLFSRLNDDFNLSSDKNALYCTTLIFHALNPVISFNVEFSKLDFAIFSGEYLYPKTLYENNQSVLIYEMKI